VGWQEPNNIMFKFRGWICSTKWPHRHDALFLHGL